MDMWLFQKEKRGPVPFMRDRFFECFQGSIQLPCLLLVCIYDVRNSEQFKLKGTDKETDINMNINTNTTTNRHEHKHTIINLLVSNWPYITSLSHHTPKHRCHAAILLNTELSLSHCKSKHIFSRWFFGLHFTGCIHLQSSSNYIASPKLKNHWACMHQNNNI